MALSATTQGISMGPLGAANLSVLHAAVWEQQTFRSCMLLALEPPMSKPSKATSFNRTHLEDFAMWCNMMCNVGLQVHQAMSRQVRHCKPFGIASPVTSWSCWCWPRYNYMMQLECVPSNEGQVHIMVTATLASCKSNAMLPTIGLQHHPCVSMWAKLKQPNMVSPKTTHTDNPINYTLDPGWG